MLNQKKKEAQDTRQKVARRKLNENRKKAMEAEDPGDIFIVSKQIKRNKEYEHKMFSALSKIAGKPRAKEKFPTFKIPML